VKSPRVSQSVLSSLQSPDSSADRKGGGVITGIVVNERHEPVRFVAVQAILADEIHKEQGQERMAGRSRSSVTDAEGHFVISALPAGEYVIAAEPQPFIPDQRAFAGAGLCHDVLPLDT
jgi:hypothetical protein